MFQNAIERSDGATAEPRAGSIPGEKNVHMTSQVTVVEHPLVAHKLSLMRDVATPSAEFRRLLRETSLLLGYELLRDIPTEKRRVETPITTVEAPVISGTKIVFVPILRAGMGLLDGLLDLVPTARVGHVGLYRNPETLAAVEYYAKLPVDISSSIVIILDPMLATGNTTIAAIDRLLETGASDIRVLSLLSAPEGLAAVARAHPEIRIFTAAIDSHLDEHGYIVPGLGDAGDRIYGTK
jgi:uracil phosphoribosyltransferase